MQFLGDTQDGGEWEGMPRPENQQIDSAALRILAMWIAHRAGIDPEIGTTIDRGFVVAHAHA